MTSMRLMLSLLVLVSCVIPQFFRSGFGSAESRVDAGDVLANNSYGKLPLSFEANHGQTDAGVQFLSRGTGHSLFLTPTEVVLALNQRLKKTDAGILPPDPGCQTVVRMKLIGANRNPKLTGMDELPGKINYFIGNDPKKWRTNIATYAKVKY